MCPETQLYTVAYLIADPSRAAMLALLVDGRARPAGELAFVAGVTPQTASSHLAKLLDGGLLLCESEGRHRYYRLAGDHVAQALEHLAAINQMHPVRQKPLSQEARTLQFARRCYDHLAGRLGIAVTRALVEKGYILPAQDKRFEITTLGAEWFGDLGLDICALNPSRRGLARQCLDWTERDHHLAGPIGVQLLTVFCDNGWLRRSKNSRIIHVTPPGWAALARHLDVVQEQFHRPT
ncbi:ArsR/SmtB family transcription factor [Mangrovitalea sediminis]|uniref:ArsR/SmtB family transcription factor n=1 Tax=Mangrovitalea sediminis TaxID=1982043 RepID=UPI000BE5EBD1|nr:helix-turn-helix transcriptional regulator [Mangrovitalea sediminis]